jgi:hypothetical protein
VTTADFDIWKSQFGTIPATASAGAVPEPSAAALFLIAAASTVAAVRRK